MLGRKKKKEETDARNHENVDQQLDSSAEANTESSAGEESTPEQELQEMKDKYLRLLAEFENYKKRTFREKLDTINTAARETVVAILPVLDDFDRAKLMADDENTDEEFSEGVGLVYHKLHQILKSRGLKPMESTGLAFDPEQHEAVTEIPAPSEDQKGTVFDTIEKGYTLNDKIIRHAKVVVAK